MATDNEPNKASGSKLSNFTNVLSEEELDAFEKNIEEGCGQINDDDFFTNLFD